MEKLKLDDCLEYIENTVFQFHPPDYHEKHPIWPGRVGLEIETLPVKFSPTENKTSLIPLHSPAESSLFGHLRILASRNNWTCHDYEKDGETLLQQVELEKKDYLTFEPGGQLEFSTLPYPCLKEVVDRVEKVQKDLDQYFAKEGIEILQTGINPWYTVEEIGLQMTKPRYRAMNEYFEKHTAMGQRMMRQTCTIQVCLDFGGSEETLVKRYLASQIIAPFATAMFAYSPFTDGENKYKSSFRSFVWRHLEAKRTGIPKFGKNLESMSKQKCAEIYYNYAIEAPVIFFEALNYKVGKPSFTFKNWVEQGVDGLYPTQKDFFTHLSLLFPEVRPKGYLELRSVDCQSREWQLVPAAFYTGLLYDETNVNKILELYLHDFDKIPQWLELSPFGLSSRILDQGAKTLINLSIEGFKRLPPCFQGESSLKSLEVFAEHFVRQGKSPSDDLLEVVAKKGLATPNGESYHTLRQKWLNLL